MSRHATARDAAWIQRLHEKSWPGTGLVPWKLLSTIRDQRVATRGVVVDLWRSAFCCYSTVKGRIYISALACKVGHASELAMVLESVIDVTGKKPIFLHLVPASVPADVGQALLWTRFRGVRKAVTEDLGGTTSHEDVEGHFFYERA